VDSPTLCERLEEAGFLHRTSGHWHWTQEAYPADAVSLRAVTSDNFVIVDITREPEVIAEVDFFERAHHRASQGEFISIRASNFMSNAWILTSVRPT